jgi:acetoacetyl-CoA synthetase
MPAAKMSTVEGTKELWRHPEPEKSQIHAFLQHVKKKHVISGDTYNDLWQWSVDQPAAFWEEVWHYTGIKASRQHDEVRPP